MSTPPRRWSFGVFLSLAVCGGISWGLLPATANETKVVASHSEPLFLRRNVFFGHRELSDILEGLSILSHAVDAFQNAPALRRDPEHVVRKRLQEALTALPALAKRRIGMSEAYTLPAMYFLFEEDAPEMAYTLIRHGLSDTRTNNQVPLLAGFVAHVFARDLDAAAAHYAALAARPDVPEWVGDLARRLKGYDDPFVTDEKVRNTLCKVMARSFPRALPFLEKNRPECREAIASLGSEASDNATSPTSGGDTTP